MIFKKILPPNGGGALRRWTRIRKDLFDNYRAMKNNPSEPSSLESSKVSSSWGTGSSSSSEAAYSDAMKSYRYKRMPPLTIYDFKRNDDAADARMADFGATKGGWRLSDDEVIGGYSRGTLTLMGKGNENTNEDDLNESDGDGNVNVNENENEQVEEQPFIRWSGKIDTRIGPKSRAKRSGFCAIRCPEYPFGVPLSSRYNALEINCRTDGRIYTVNLKVSSYFPDDLYQALITVDDSAVSKKNMKGERGSGGTSEFLTLVLPFSDFILTSNVLVRETQRKLDGRVKMEQLGLTIMDGKDGPFQFDLARIRAVNYYNGRIVGDK